MSHSLFKNDIPCISVWNSHTNVFCCGADKQHPEFLQLFVICLENTRYVGVGWDMPGHSCCGVTGGKLNVKLVLVVARIVGFSVSGKRIRHLLSRKDIKRLKKVNYGWTNSNLLGILPPFLWESVTTKYSFCFHKEKQKKIPPESTLFDYFHGHKNSGLQRNSHLSLVRYKSNKEFRFFLK